MKKEYRVSIEKIDDELFWILYKGETVIDSLTWEEAQQHEYVKAYLFRKHNIPFEATGYS